MAQHFPKAAVLSTSVAAAANEVGPLESAKGWADGGPMVYQSVKTPDPAGSTCAQPLQYTRGSTYLLKGQSHLISTRRAIGALSKGRGKTHSSGQ